MVQQWADCVSGRDRLRALEVSVEKPRAMGAVVAQIGDCPDDFPERGGMHEAKIIGHSPGISGLHQLEEIRQAPETEKFGYGPDR